MRKMAVILLAVVLIACAGSKQVVKAPRPDWVDGVPFAADVIQGVGMAPKMKNEAAQRARAEHQARLALARTMRTRVAGLIRDWVNENQDYFTNAGESLSYFESVSEELTQATLVGSQVVRFWLDPDTKTLYALAVISKTDAIESLIEKMKKLSNEQTRIIQERAEEAFKRLEERLKEQW